MRNCDIKRRMAKNVLALNSLLAGDKQPAVQAIQLGELTDEQLSAGLKARITTDYRHLAQSPRSVSAILMASAALVLADMSLAENANKKLTNFIL